ncbi:MAG: hypothetical protein CME63_17300 [Halobacteriovoraceae bacterium]|nr:hypothetical protein [Halobacteriovoraceae bacterium]|tara:strand:- start:206540 stop:207301 length:762 start_codon:yes stop_codon:yes gene_type:complete
MSRHSLKILSYNIHKGFSASGIRFTLKEIKHFLHQMDPDVIFLQEAVGKHTGKKIVIPDFQTNNQVDFLAKELYPYKIYGANKKHKNGHHGNAILSKYPIELIENHNISQNRFESRGLLHVTLKWPPHHEAIHEPIHLFNTHLNLLERDRQKQLHWIAEHIQRELHQNHAVILAGDFNDWRKKAVGHIEENILLKEVFTQTQRYPNSFPSFLPGLSLDRIFYKNLKLIEAAQINDKKYRNLSDHLPLLAHFKL